MDSAIEQAIRLRAGVICEYCPAIQAYYQERFQIDHIIARQRHGATSLDNLALFGVECNRRKEPDLAGIDPLTSTHCDLFSDLFNPRLDNWNEHFV